MKKVAAIAVLILLLSGCSYADFTKLLPAAPTPLPPPDTATPTVYMTPTETPTITPTQPTPTYTTTPTLIYLNGVPAATDTQTPPATLWVLATATPSLEGTSSLVGNGPFSTILVPGKQLLWGSCEPSVIKVTVKVQDSVPAHTVLIFLRLKDTNSNDTTTWGGGAIMDRQGGGVFTYNLTAKAFEHYHDYMRAWGQYQFVALDNHLDRLGASSQFLDTLTIAPCP